MTNTAITKTIKKVEENLKEYSLGFSRLVALPKRVRSNFNTSFLLNINTDTTKCNEYQKKFLENLTETEYINWLKNA